MGTDISYTIRASLAHFNTFSKIYRPLVFTLATLVSTTKPLTSEWTINVGACARSRPSLGTVSRRCNLIGRRSASLSAGRSVAVLSPRPVALCLGGGRLRRGRRRLHLGLRLVVVVIQLTERDQLLFRWGRPVALVELLERTARGRVTSRTTERQ